MIICKESSSNLLYALRMTPDIDLMYYQVDFKLDSVNLKERRDIPKRREKTGLSTSSAHPVCFAARPNQRNQNQSKFDSRLFGCRENRSRDHRGISWSDGGADCSLSRVRP